MTLELACGLAISFGLLTHSALLVRQSWHLCEWFKALEHHEATLSRLIEQLQEHRADDAPPDTAEPVRDGASASLLDEQRRLQLACRIATRSCGWHRGDEHRTVQKTGPRVNTAPSPHGGEPMASSMVARMDDPPTRPSPPAPAAIDPACARCGRPYAEPPPVAVPDLCGACLTALQRDFEQRCREESLAADDLARAAHQRRLGYADTHESRDYGALPPLDRCRYDAAAAVCLRSLDPEWRRVALDRAAERLVKAIVEDAPVLALYAEASRATKVRHLANAILNVYHQTLDGLQPLSPLEQVQFERRQEAAVATCAICLARVDVDRVVVRAGRWICEDCEAEGER